MTFLNKQIYALCTLIAAIADDPAGTPVVFYIGVSLLDALSGRRGKPYLINSVHPY